MNLKQPRWEPAARCEWPECTSPAALQTGRWCSFHWDAGRRLEDAAKRPHDHLDVWKGVARNLLAKEKRP